MDHEVVDKEGNTIQTSSKTVDCDQFLKIVDEFESIRVGVEGGNPPFNKVYFAVNKQEVIDIIRMNKMKVTYSIQYNSLVNTKLEDTLFIDKLEQTII